jgi:uncharacterized Zn finger protein
MTRLPVLSEKAIRDHVGERNFNVGREYQQDGSIFSPRREGATLKARCQGSSGGPYRVEATLTEGGVASSDCSCPVGGGGHCKHVGALLHAWRESPDEFREVEEVDTALGRRSKAELIALIKLMLRREPDLEVLLEAPLPGGKRKGAVKPETYRRQAEAAFDRSDGSYGSSSEVADDLEAVKAVGDEFLARGDTGAAVAVYQGLVEGICGRYGEEEDQEGDIGSVLVGCAEALGRCLAALQDQPGQREGILRALFDVVLLDAERGGTGLGDEAGDVIDAQATPEERRTLAGWIRKELPGAGDWVRRTLGGWLLELEQEQLDDQAYLKLARDSGLKGAVVARLLERGRTDEALEEIRGASDYELLNYADLLVSHRQGKTADALVAERARTSRDPRLVEWLKGRAAKRHDRAAVLELTEQLFRGQPSLERYKEVRELAQKQGSWEEVRPRLLQQLQTSKRDDVLVRVYLDEGAIDEALARVKNNRPGIGYYYGLALDLEVAAAAERTHPREALAIYRKHAEALIEARGRESYKAACRHLRKVRALMEQLGEAKGWRTYSDGLRERHKTLRALLEEMEVAKL